MGAVSNIVESVGDVVGSAVEAVGDAGSWIDDKVNEEIPGGWATVAAVTGVYYAPEIAAAMGAETAGTAGTLGAGEGAAFGMSDAMAAELGLSGGSAFEAGAAGDVLAGMGIEGAGATSPWGINPGLPTTEFGTFNPATVSAPGVNTGALSGMEYLGGTGSLPVGTAGLTAEQLANATALGQVGTNAASGMGYLGGAESLPSGTAGITGVEGGLSSSDLNNARKLADALNKSGQNFASAANPQFSGVGQGYSMPNPFFRTEEKPIMAETKANQPVYLGQLAQLLRG
jgi:hypothetical protein